MRRMAQATGAVCWGWLLALLVPLLLEACASWTYPTKPAKGFIAHIFRQMFASVHPHGLPSLPTTLVRLAIWQGKFHLAVRQKDGDARGMPVHHGLLMGAVGDPQHLHLGILDLHFVVRRI